MLITVADYLKIYCLRIFFRHYSNNKNSGEKKQLLGHSRTLLIVETRVKKNLQLCFVLPKWKPF